MHATPNTRHASTIAPSAGVELAFPRLLLDDGTNIARLTRIDGSRQVIGRCTPADICLTNDPYVSAIHASITWVNAFGAHVLHDCGSANGTALDGVHITRPARLANGARIRIGLTDLIYCNKMPMPGYVSTLTGLEVAPHDWNTSVLQAHDSSGI